MFSGIVEECATLVAMVKDQENVHFTFKCSFVSELKNRPECVSQWCLPDGSQSDR